MAYASLRAPLMKLAAIVFAFVLVGCGGKSFVDDVDGGDGGHSSDGSHEDVGTSDDANGCSNPPSGCTRISATTCQLDCNTCQCTNGGWGCTLMGCADASPTCPATQPQSGSYCPVDGLGCGPWSPGCAPSCSCQSHQWKCLYPPCPPPVCPPSPPSGSCNGQVGLDCNYGSGCNTEQCQCVAQGSGASWLCSGTACTDAGHTGDAGH